MNRMALIVLLLTIFAGCNSRTTLLNDLSDRVVGYGIEIRSENQQLISDMLGYISSLESKRGNDNIQIIINLKNRDDCKECFSYSYEYKNSEITIDISADYPLGAQYGVYEILEYIGYRFFTPYEYFIPENLHIRNLLNSLEQNKGVLFKPDMGQRGLHLHTLHPIEALYDFWIGTEPEEAYKIIDWIIKIRGNYIQWVALNDIRKEDRYLEWRLKTEKIIELAHRRGIKVGINCLVFANSSLQNGYLIEDEDSLRIIRDLNFDVLNLSFGEFIGNEPDVFIRKLEDIKSRVRTVRGDIDITATIHVGNYPNLWVEYNNETLLYYFLVKYIEDIVPFVHTVMYFNLIESSVGAYNHRSFKEHKEFLLDYIHKGKKVVYFPESAYWIAFDNSVPLFLPLYIRSRFLDLELMNSELKNDTARQNTGHIVFTSGWEWGYYMTDYLSTKMAYKFTDKWQSEIEYMLMPLSEKYKEVSAIINQLIEVQAEYLINRRLAAYYAGVDAYVELGHKAGIIGQPDRVMVDELDDLSDEKRGNFENSIISNLREFSEKMREINDKVGILSKLVTDKFLHEILDGIEIDYLRSEFVYLLYASAFYKDKSLLDEAKLYIDRAREIVKRRHGSLHYPDKELILNSNENPTIYKFGYLKQADTLCLWVRDWIKVSTKFGEDNQPVPSCIE